MAIPKDIRLTRHPKRKHLAYRIQDDGCLEVLAPQKWSLRRIKTLLMENEQAILEAYAKHRPATLPELQWLLGQPFVLEYTDSVKKPVFDGDGLHCKVSPSLTPAALTKEMEIYYKSMARPLFEERMEVCASHFKPALPPHRLSRIGAARTRWGSCSSKGNINLNAMLMQYPIKCIDYVITHELCHLIELNHGAAFYKHLENVMPDWKLHEQWFRSPLPVTVEGMTAFVQKLNRQSKSDEPEFIIPAL